MLSNALKKLYLSRNINRFDEMSDLGSWIRYCCLKCQFKFHLN